jgi:hypothetical protein
MNRRMFLRGAGGAALGIPFLGSLQPAFSASTYRSTRFVAMATQHGGLWNDRMWPGDAMLTETRDVGHVVRRGDLTPTYTGSDVALSPVLTASSARLTPAVLAEMNLVRGVDIPFYLSHHTGGYLGNFGRNDTEYESASPMPYLPTIDQVMAWSDSFYSPGSSFVQRSVHLGHQMSWGWSNPVNRSGRVDPMPTTWSNLALFDTLFGGPVEPGEERRLVVDKVLESFHRLRDGAFGPGRRLSAGDRVRLDEHIERLYEVERKLASAVSCDVATRPTENTEWHPGAYFESMDLDEVYAYHELWNEVLALALICGATRIATYNCLHTFEPYVGDWHQEVAHEAWVSEQAVDRMVRGHQRFFDRVFVDLCHRLDVPDADGETVLHNSLLFWCQESGPTTHDSVSMPVIAVGSAGGALRTGQYVDYRDRDNLSIPAPWDDNPVILDHRPGLLYGQWLATCLEACGVPRSEWEVANNPGYGIHENTNWDAWPAHVEAMGNDVLPFLAP